MLTRDLTAKAEVCRLLEGRDTPLFVSTFLSEFQREQVSQMGWKTVQSSDPKMTSNKAEFRKEAPHFGFRVADGGTITSLEDMHTAATLVLGTIVRRIGYGHTPSEQGWTGGWMKLAHGSGGDFVQSLAVSQDAILSEYDSITDALSRGESLRTIVNTLLASHSNSPLGEATHASVNGAYEKLRASVVQAFTVNDYGPGALEKFWPATSLSLRIPRASLSNRMFGRMAKLSPTQVTSWWCITMELQRFLAGLNSSPGPEGDYGGALPSPGRGHWR